MDPAPDQAADGSDQPSGVSTVELLFDLVYVFTLTQLTRVVADEPTAGQRPSPARGDESRPPAPS